MKQLTLNFESTTETYLDRTEFCHPLLGDDCRTAVRGKDAGAFFGAETFQWTNGVRGLCVLVTRAKVRQFGMEGRSIMADLQGGAQSLASALDSGIMKNVCWLNGILGSDSAGQCLVRRLVRRSNSGMRRSGPVSLSLNARFLAPDEIRIFVNGSEAAEPFNLFNLLHSLETNTTIVSGVGGIPNDSSDSSSAAA